MKQITNNNVRRSMIAKAPRVPEIVSKRGRKSQHCRTLLDYI